LRKLEEDLAGCQRRELRGTRQRPAHPIAGRLGVVAVLGGARLGAAAGTAAEVRTITTASRRNKKLIRFTEFSCL